MQIDKEAVTETVKRKVMKTQKDWVDYFNNKGKKMISASDIYRIAKEGNKKLIKSLAKDFQEQWEVTSTRIVYNKETLEAEIIHDADSKVTTTKSIKLLIPIFQGEATKESEEYLQALFDTKDTFEEITKTLKSFNESKNVYLYTPDQMGRSYKSIRAVGLGFLGWSFHVDGGGWFGGIDGLSRGVTIDSAPKEQGRIKEVSP